MVNAILEFHNEFPALASPFFIRLPNDGVLLFKRGKFGTAVPGSRDWCQEAGGLESVAGNLLRCRVAVSQDIAADSPFGGEDDRDRLARRHRNDLDRI